ncbi:MAG: hypothetical protein KGZ83_18355 [Sulfuricella sp.]|nr:hypothetical protein [Sulfuricella sp.]
MNKNHLFKLAEQYFIFDDGLSESNLIRKIQVAEGNLDCFATDRVWTCNQFECKWRKDCLAKSAESAPLDI